MPTERPSRIRRRIVFMMVMAACVFVGDRLVGAALERVVLVSQFRYSKLYRGDIDAGVILFGNSRALHTIYAPRASQRLGVPVFNAGYNGLDTSVVAVLVEDYLRLNDPPDAILVELTGMPVEPGNRIGLFAMYCGRSEGLLTLLRRYEPRRALGCRLSHVFRANGPMFSHVLLRLNQSDQNWAIPTAVVANEDLLAERLGPEDLAIDPTNLEAFARIVEVCDRAGVRLIPLIAPYAPGALGDYDIAAEYRAAIERVAPGCPPIADYSRALDDIEMFADRVHTNRRGADALAELLIVDGVLTTNR